VLHRDLKPGNVMLGRFGETLVVDWGLAKPADLPESAASEEGRLVPPSGGGEATLPGTAVGTPAYMSPEQAAGRLDRLGPASDVYSLGATLYCVLTGRAPVEARDRDEALRRVERGEFPRPRELDRAIPAALEAVCLKAMARDPAGRYATPLDLAGDLEHWLADEPVSAHREPWTTRARRWVGRHRTGVTAAAAAALVALAASGYLAYEARLRAGQRLTAARGRVDALATAEVRALPLVVAQLGADRRLVRERLDRLERGDGRGRLAAALALLPEEPGQAETLADRLLQAEASPDEVLVIRDALVANRQADRVAGRVRRAVPAKAAELTDAQLRALGALAGMAPKDPLLATHAPALARKLVRENPLLVGSWREAFQPIAAALADPLREVYADRHAAEPRALAYTLLYEFATRPGNPTEPEDLAVLIGDADPDQFRQLLLLLDSASNRERAIDVLAPKLKEPARFDDDLARRQGRMAMALLRLGKPEAVWPLFRHRDDPSLRTELIHNLVRFGFEPRSVIDRLRDERDVSARRSLILCLGEFPVESIPEADRRALAERFLAWYRTDPDPGTHGALAWMLRRRWSRGTELARIDRELAGPDLPRDRGWFVNGQAQTFAIVRGPVEFRMGSTKQTDPDRELDEVQHLRRIGRSFAIATREVTVAEYGRFLDEVPDRAEDYRDHPQFKQDIPSPDCAIGMVTWYKAAQYCNWLSAKEGIPEDQWCYPKQIEPGTDQPADSLERAGYRLPTEGEWEYACRAGAASSRPYGRAETRLVEYGWHLTNSGRTLHPTGTLKPNDLGLFDMLGNAYEWCSDPFRAYKPGPDGKIFDSFTYVKSSDDNGRVLRGGAFNETASSLRAAYRFRNYPWFHNAADGLRLARTIH
jgi:formylglycine-generating enzyme required for sulfatase activity